MIEFKWKASAFKLIPFFLDFFCTIERRERLDYGIVRLSICASFYSTSAVWNVHQLNNIEKLWRPSYVEIAQEFRNLAFYMIDSIKIKFVTWWESFHLNCNWYPCNDKIQLTRKFGFDYFQMRINMKEGDDESRGERFVTHVDLTEQSTVSVKHVYVVKALQIVVVRIIRRNKN